jgi:hypothetical protein
MAKKTLKEQIDEVEGKGYKVEITHERYLDASSGDISPRGGHTGVSIYDPNTDIIVANGSAECSIHDNYNRKVGASIALGRARKELGI